MKIFWSILGLIVLVLGTLTYRNFFPAEPQAPIPPTETVVAEPDSTGGSAITQKPVAAEEPVVAKPANKPAIWKKVGWWLKRHMALVAILVLAAAGVIIALLVIFRRNRRPRYRYGAATDESYLKTKLKFAWPWVLGAIGCLAYASYLAGPEIQDHRFFPLLVLGIFCVWPAWRAFARIPYGKGKKAMVPTAGQFFKKIFVSGPAMTAAILILFYLMFYNRLN